MPPQPDSPGSARPPQRRPATCQKAASPAGESKTTAGPRRRARQAGQLDAGPLAADIASFRLHLAAEGKSARTIGGYTGAVRWFAAAWLLPQAGRTSWDQADAQDVQRWMVHLLGRYSSAYASIQFRALRQFFKWLAAEENSPTRWADSARPRSPCRKSRYSPA
jgi:hypothetical protein